jgi:hemin uptake protein HemP
MDKLAVSPEINSRKQVTLMDRDSRIHSDVLFSQGNEIIIQHQGEHYRLRRTRNDKLILTK